MSKRQASTEDSPRKKLRRIQTFRKEYTDEFSDIVVGKSGSTFAYCQLCCKEFSIGHGGRDDCRRHVENKKHSDRAKHRSSTPTVSGFFTKPAPVTKTTRAEIMLVDLVTEMNLPLSSLDKFTEAFKVMFADSETARQFQCCRSKGTAIVKEIANKTHSELVEVMRTHPFTISTDGSNDSGSCKLFPIVVRIVKPETMQITSDVLSVPFCEGSATGENIFRLIEKELETNAIPWKNILALGSDNAPVMVGREKGVFGYLQKIQPSAFLSGCACHLIHLAAEKGAACLSFDISQLLIEVYYYLDKSSKRQAILKDMQFVSDIKQNKILKHVSTRWLSIGRCLPRLIENWKPLHEFFKHQEKAATSATEKEKTKKMRKIFASPTNQLFCMFLADAIKPFEEINTELQADCPKIHVLKRCLESLLRKLFVKFVKPDAMIHKSITEVKFAENMKKDEELFIGTLAQDFILKKEVNCLRNERITEFYCNVKSFYETSCKYILQKLPLSEDLLRHAEVADPALQTSSSSASIDYFLKRFPALLPEGASVEDVQLEFAEFQSTDIRECNRERVDSTWAEISKLQENGKKLFKVLPLVMLGILTIPHSSAHCERIFSIVRKNQTEFRSRLSHSTMEALLVAKTRTGEAVNRKYSECYLRDLKSAYFRTLKH